MLECNSAWGLLKDSAARKAGCSSREAHFLRELETFLRSWRRFSDPRWVPWKISREPSHRESKVKEIPPLIPPLPSNGGFLGSELHANSNAPESLDSNSTWCGGDDAFLSAPQSRDGAPGHRPFMRRCLFGSSRSAALPIGGTATALPPLHHVDSQQDHPGLGRRHGPVHGSAAQAEAASTWTSNLWAQSAAH